ncbi:MAG: glycosyltransferase [Euzebyales bacterium]|nr:glycosyltransferase [Euzebyales bacterium]
MTEIPDHVRRWAAQRAERRANREFEAADALRERIAGAGYDVTDTPGGPVVARARRYTTLLPDQVPDRRGEDDAHDASVLLLLDDPTGGEQPGWVVGDATRCLAGVLATSEGHDYEIIILDNGVGGAAGDWAADAARNPGVRAEHLTEPVGFAAARQLQHRMAVGRVVLWLDTGVEPTGDLLGALKTAFTDHAVGVAGRWGGNLGSSVSHFDPVEPPPQGMCDVAAVWGYLLGLRRDLLRNGGVELDPGFRFYRNADADLAFRVRAAGARTVVAALPAVQHVHRLYAETPADVVERESERNYRRLLARWRGEMEALAQR